MYVFALYRILYVAEQQNEEDIHLHQSSYLLLNREPNMSPKRASEYQYVKYLVYVLLFAKDEVRPELRRGCSVK